MTTMSQFATIALLGTSALGLTFSTQAGAQSQAPSAPAAVGESTSLPPSESVPHASTPVDVRGSEASASAGEVLPSRAADEAPRTLLGRGSKHSFGGFGGIDAAYTRMAGTDASVICGEGGFILDHTFTIGAAGCGLVSKINAESYGDVVHAGGDRLSFGYGGLTVRYQFFPREIVNVAVGTLIGGGVVGIQESWLNRRHDDPVVKSSDAVFVVEPRVSGFLNLTRWARVGLFGGYRIVSGVGTRNLSSEDLSGPTAGATVHFGWL